MWLSPAGVQMALIWLSIVGPSLMLLEHINGPLLVDSPKSVLNLQNCAILEAFRTSRSTDSLKWSELTLLSHYLLFQICFLKWSFFEDFQKKWKVQKKCYDHLTWSLSTFTERKGNIYKSSNWAIHNLCDIQRKNSVAVEKNISNNFQFLHRIVQKGRRGKVRSAKPIKFLPFRDAVQRTAMHWWCRSRRLLLTK